MRLILDGGYVEYDICDDEVIIEYIQAIKKRNGVGTKLIIGVKEIASNLGLPIGLYAYPQDNSINEQDLIRFYFKNGFEYDPNDCDGKLLAWGK